MALIKCTECGNDVSDKATSCPKCGNPIITKIDSTSAQINIVQSSQKLRSNQAIAALLMIIGLVGLFVMPWKTFSGMLLLIGFFWLVIAHFKHS
jgi:uncharacterized membrane protein YvbJ